MLALTAAALVLSATAHPAYGDGTCVDVTVNGVKRADTLCPPADDLTPRSFTTKGHTVYFGAAGGRVTLTFARRTLRVRPSADDAYAVAIKGKPTLGAIAVGSKQRDVDVFGLPQPGRRATVLKLTDEAGRRVRLVAAAPRALTPSGRRRRVTLCTGIQLAPAFSPGRVLCATNPRAFQVRFSADCKHDRQLVYGLAPKRIARAVATLSNGRTTPLTVTRVPRAVKRSGVVFTKRLQGPQATKVRGYDASGKLLATAPLSGGCT